MRKTVFLCICALTLLLLFPAPAHADMGPKPSVIIYFKGLEGEAYYATLLANVTSTGPYSLLEEGSGRYAHYQKGDKDYDIFLRFVEYKAPEGFYFLQFLEDCTESHQLSWTYYPPKQFKILLYFPETDRFIVSQETYQRYAFDSYFTADTSGFDMAVTQGEVNIGLVKSYDYGAELLSLLARILLTLAIELAIALLFGFFGKKVFRFIVVVNLITQIALNVTLNIIDYYSGLLAFAFFYILLEIVVFIVEGRIYATNLQKHSEKHISRWKPWLYAFVANALSFALGWHLAFSIPEIF